MYNIKYCIIIKSIRKRASYQRECENRERVPT